ncbi:hypothetical protein HORIV_40680 [Vreelandella olivaria]|uniref:Fe/B12 periplasmic-binding domain-containing protein n=1 Tax=Vreelandella olivaria TaxID=390919 RepID=A0ABN5X492_9GAMM|nr:hypothetical protein HORIV_40680 [Halomonas olivaria]
MTTTIAASAVGLAQAAYPSTDYPLTLTNCGVEISVASPPERTVTVGQSATEILYSLGLADRVNGTSVWFNPVLPSLLRPMKRSSGSPMTTLALRPWSISGLTW